MSATFVAKPVVSSDELDLATKVSDLQDAGAPPEEYMPLAEAHYASMRAECNRFKPWRDPSDPNRKQVTCYSGAIGRLVLGEKCLNCRALCFSFHPKVDKRVRQSFTSILINIGDAEKITTFTELGCADIPRGAGKTQRNRKGAHHA